MKRSMFRADLRGHLRGLGRRVTARFAEDDSERGDVPGWVLVTLMTAGLVVTLWAVAGPALTTVFNTAISRVLGT